MILKNGLISAMIMIICLTTIFYCSSTAGIVTDEKGEAIIDSLVCTKEGDLLIIYHREYMPTDIMEDSGPYVRVIRVSKDGAFQNINDSDVLLNSFPYSSWGISFWGLVQEDDNALRLVGWNRGELTEVTWEKDNKSLEINNRGTSFTYPHWLCSNVYFPRQARYTQKLQNYTLIGWSECENEPVVIVTDGTTTDLINLQNMSQGVNYQAYAAFMADNSSEAYYAHLISGTNDILIRHLSSNMTILNETRFTIRGTPSSMHHYTGRVAEITYFNTLLGLNGDPYVGIRILDPNYETPLDTYQHTFELVNLKKNASFVMSIPAKDNSYDWNGLVDDSGTFHGLFYTDTEDNYIRYVRVTSDGNIDFDTTFTPGKKRTNRHDFSGNEPLTGEKIITFWGEDYIIGAENSGIFLFELASGTMVNFEPEIISFISYEQYGMEGEGLYGLAAIVIITFWWRKKQK